MKINFIDLKAQYESIKDEIDAALAEVISTNSFVLGPSVARFEDNYARFCGTKYCIGVNSGTSALFMILKALEIGDGDEVIIPANTFIATAAAITYSGAIPVLVDVDPDTRNIDLNKIESAITSRTKAIMPVHLYGNMVDMSAINSICKKHHLLAIEDAAQAQGAKFKDKTAGFFGLAAGFSFYPAKNLGAMGEGGAITTSDDSLDEKLRKLRDHGSLKKYYHDIIGYNTRMEGFQGAVLNVKLKYLDKWNKERNRVAQTYREYLDGLPVKFPAECDNNFQVYHQFVIETDRRDKLQKYLADNGVPTLIHYPIPIHKQKAFIDAGYLAETAYPVTEKLAASILSLPIYPELPDESVKYICTKIKGFFE
jgi:dTDP-4-amino-4,6-dideoxygalactose transaminase